MTMRHLLLTLVATAVLGSTAHAEAFDPAGWKLLGTEAPGESGVANLAIPEYLGEIAQVAVVVTGAATLTKVEVKRGPGANQSVALDVKLAANEGKELALEAAAIPIYLVSVTLEDVEAGTQIRVFGRDPDEKPRAPVTWDSKGWVELASAGVSRRMSTLRSAETGTMRMIAIVPDTELELGPVAVQLENDLGPLRDSHLTALAPGEPYLVDLSKETVGVRSVQLSGVIVGAFASTVRLYGLPSLETTKLKGRTLTRLFGKRTDEAADAGKYDDLGWQLIGEDEVDLIDDEVVVAKKKRKATYSQIKVVVVGDAVKLRTLDVHLGGKKAKTQREALEQTYGDGDDSVVIDIPGKRRSIQKVRLQYQKHKLDASTKVRIYAR